MTIIVDKVCNAVTETTYSQRCHVCGATSSLMTDIKETLKIETDPSTLTFGLSPLRTWIKCFQCTLHIS